MHQTIVHKEDCQLPQSNEQEKESHLWEIKTPRLESQQKVQNIYVNTICDTGTPTWIIKTVLGPVRLPQGSDRNK